MHPKQWTSLDRSGLHILPGGFYLDPVRAVATAVVTHGHADHARRGHGTVVATPETHVVMRGRYGANYCERAIELRLHETLAIGAAEITFYPAGHVLGSVQVQVCFEGMRLGVSGDYKRGGGDPTCADFEPVPCDVFLTEATFAYPHFRFPEVALELDKLLRSLEQFPERPHCVAAYSLGKAQRMIAMLRERGWSEPIYVHPSVLRMNEVYEQLGIALGVVRPLAQYRYRKDRSRADLIVSPPSGNVPLPLPSGVRTLHCSASGWNHVRKHARAAHTDLALVVSDHCDWPGLLCSIEETGAQEVWVTHGPAESLQAWAQHHSCRVLDLKEVWHG